MPEGAITVARKKTKKEWVGCLGRSIRKALRSCQHLHFLRLMMHSPESQVESNDSLLHYFVKLYTNLLIIAPYENVYVYHTTASRAKAVSETCQPSAPTARIRL